VGKFGPTAYVGFTGVTEPYGSYGNLQNWRYVGWSGSDAPLPPKAPSNLQANPSDPNTINLTWQDNADNAQGYLVYRKGVFDSDYSLIAALPPDAASYVDTSAGTSQFQAYRIVAHNASGLADPAAATTDPPPIAPDNLQVTNL